MLNPNLIPKSLCLAGFVGQTRKVKILDMFFIFLEDPFVPVIHTRGAVIYVALVTLLVHKKSCGKWQSIKHLESEREVKEYNIIILYLFFYKYVCIIEYKCKHGIISFVFGGRLLGKSKSFGGRCRRIWLLPLYLCFVLSSVYRVCWRCCCILSFEGLLLSFASLVVWEIMPTDASFHCLIALDSPGYSWREISYSFVIFCLLKQSSQIWEASSLRKRKAQGLLYWLVFNHSYFS